jgi:hypothetical protein
MIRFMAMGFSRPIMEASMKDYGSMINRMDMAKKLGLMDRRMKEATSTE